MKQIITKKLVLIRQKYYTTIPQRESEKLWIYTETRSVEVNIEVYETTLRGKGGRSCFSIYQIILIKIKKEPFVN